MKPYEEKLKHFLDKICPGKPFDENDKSKNCDECPEWIEGFCEHPEHPSIKKTQVN